ncbi:hypothetical protein Cni_G08753 [Canna indica]|uniref:DUF4283 domain-containing protein n=1 Tax=Canna indica TaxID=4628 RepID=A0AAQ3K108_9LILI|nr:hypothetical protein Cni_G08753 [Canna indica]
MTSSWRRRKTRHSGEPPGGVVRSGNSTRPAPKQRKRCVSHSRGTAGEILEEGGDDVKSAWPLWAGPHTCYNGNDNGKQGCKAERIRKDCLSSDCSLQLGNMKLESLVIADQHAAVNMYPGPVHTARHTLGTGFARSIRQMITHDFCVPLVPQRPLVVLLPHTTARMMKKMKEAWRRPSLTEASADSEKKGPWPRVTITKEECRSLRKPWRRALIVKVLGKSVSYKILEHKVSELLGLELGFEMIDLDHGFFLVRVYSKKDYPHVLPNGPWGEIGHYLTVCKWRQNFRPSKETISSNLVWVRLSEIPISFKKEIPYLSGNKLISKATRKHLEKALAQVAIECGEEEAFFSQHLLPKGDIPRTVLLKPGVISFSAHDSLFQGLKHSRPLYVKIRLGNYE